MAKIEVTGEMRSRILTGLQAADLTGAARVIRIRPYQKYLSIAACLAVILMGALLVPGLLDRIPIEGKPVVSGPSGGILEVGSAEELSNKVGFAVKGIEALPFPVLKYTYQSYWEELAQIEYTGDGGTVTFRKSVGSEDNSGIYNTYDTVSELPVGSVIATMKGNGGRYYLAVWTDGEFSYSVYSEAGVSKEDLIQMVSHAG